MPQQLPPLLNTLTDLLTAPLPPLLSDLSAHADVAADYAWFRQMVQDVLPEHAQDILQQDDRYRELDAFATHFGNTYFPINEGIFHQEILEYDDEDDGTSCWGRLRMALYWGVDGIDTDDLDSIWDDRTPGEAMLGTMCAVDQNRAEPGIRIAWLQHAAQTVPQSTLELIPPEGYSQDDLTRAVNGTWAQGLFHTCIWLNASSGNEFIDIPPNQGEWNPFSDLWDQETLGNISLLWREAEQSVTSRFQLASLIEEDLPVRTLELINFVNSRLNPSSPHPEVPQ